MKKKYDHDLTGRRFGKLVVLGIGEGKGPGRTSWCCKCECGQVKTIRGDALKAGYTKSCGSCRRSRQTMGSLFTMVPVTISEVCQKAGLMGFTFGQYTAWEYVRRIGSKP